MRILAHFICLSKLDELSIHNYNVRIAGISFLGKRINFNPLIALSDHLTHENFSSLDFTYQIKCTSIHNYNDRIAEISFLAKRINFNPLIPLSDNLTYENFSS